MPQGDSKFDDWSKKIIKQAHRCDWNGYDEKTAARDAILFQTSDPKLRKKILAENLNYDQTVAWGRTHESSSKKAKQVESTTSTEQKVRKLEDRVSRLQVEEKQRLVPCKTCPRKVHREGNKCPGLHVDKKVISKGRRYEKGLHLKLKGSPVLLRKVIK